MLVQVPATNSPRAEDCTEVNAGDYTVGWICATTTEYVAAQLFLDQTHGSFANESRPSSYTLGKIGQHNVVIASFPDGEYGMATAATVARDMLHEFPNVKIGLRVGIGGGAPSLNHDIRLGDIVVSAPRDRHGGVLQYDLSRAVEGQSLQQTGCLNQPPTVLRTAVAGLETWYEIKGHQIKETVDRVLEKNPILQKKYQRPNPSNDRLYDAGVIHPSHSKERCAKACGDDPSKMIQRVKRTEEQDNPAIHYGLIVSTNQLMSDATIRDTLAREVGVLCFEMEAAGLMNHFPCLVIYGICDYSDSHKNNEWQGYAAMTAAAYTKDLLLRIPPNKIEAENRISLYLQSEVSGVAAEAPAAGL